MNTTAPKHIFEEIKKSYLKLNPECIDEKIRDIVMRFKDMPFFDKVCPRWSCQGHSNKSRDSDFYIIFVTQDNGSEILFKFYELIYKTYLEKHGLLYLAGNQFSVVPLIYHTDSDIPFSNIQVSTTTNGNEKLTDICIDVWNEVLDKMQKEYK